MTTFRVNTKMTTYGEAYIHIPGEFRGFPTKEQIWELDENGDIDWSFDKIGYSSEIIDVEVVEDSP